MNDSGPSLLARPALMRRADVYMESSAKLSKKTVASYEKEFALRHHVYVSHKQTFENDLEISDISIDALIACIIPSLYMTSIVQELHSSESACVPIYDVLKWLVFLRPELRIVKGTVAEALGLINEALEEDRIEESMVTDDDREGARKPPSAPPCLAAGSTAPSTSTIPGSMTGVASTSSSDSTGFAIIDTTTHSVDAIVRSDMFIGGPALSEPSLWGLYEDMVAVLQSKLAQKRGKGDSKGDLSTSTGACTSNSATAQEHVVTGGVTSPVKVDALRLPEVVSPPASEAIDASGKDFEPFKKEDSIPQSEVGVDPSASCDQGSGANIGSAPARVEGCTDTALFPEPEDVKAATSRQAGGTEALISSSSGASNTLPTSPLWETFSTPAATKTITSNTHSNADDIYTGSVHRKMDVLASKEPTACIYGVLTDAQRWYFCKLFYCSEISAYKITTSPCLPLYSFDNRSSKAGTLKGTGESREIIRHLLRCTYPDAKKALLFEDMDARVAELKAGLSKGVGSFFRSLSQGALVESLQERLAQQTKVANAALEQAKQLERLRLEKDAEIEKLRQLLRE